MNRRDIHAPSPDLALLSTCRILALRSWLHALSRRRCSSRASQKYRLAAGLPRLHPRQQDRLPTSDPVIEAIRKRTDLAAWLMGNARRAVSRPRLFIVSFPILFFIGVSA